MKGLLAHIALVMASLVPVAGLGETEHGEGGTNAKLIAYYKQAAHYRAVKKDVLEWHKTTQNGCVAFASTALRHIGVDVPQDETLDGHGVSRITLAFSRWLKERLGWERIDDMADLRPGDVVFTADDPCCEGYPAHVFVFHSWKERKARVARVIDNQGFTHARALVVDDGDDTSPFAYALRAPDSP
jgi:hypothetical protein